MNSDISKINQKCAKSVENDFKCSKSIVNADKGFLAFKKFIIFLMGRGYIEGIRIDTLHFTIENSYFCIK